VTLTLTSTFSVLVFVTFGFYFNTVLDKLTSVSFRMHIKTCMSYHTIYSSPVLTECAAVWQRVIERLDEPALPAARVQPADGKLVWFLDKAAASQLFTSWNCLALYVLRVANAGTQESRTAQPPKMWGPGVNTGNAFPTNLHKRSRPTHFFCIFRMFMYEILEEIDYHVCKSIWLWRGRTNQRCDKLAVKHFSNFYNCLTVYFKVTLKNWHIASQQGLWWAKNGMCRQNLHVATLLLLL